MDKAFQEKDLTPKGPVALRLLPITHKEFNEFIKGKGFKGRNNYKLRDLKAMARQGAAEAAPGVPEHSQ